MKQQQDQNQQQFQPANQQQMQSQDQVSKNPKNLMTITVYQYSNCFICESKQYQLTGIDDYLVIERGGKIYQTKTKPQQQTQAIKSKDCSLFLGILHILDQPFLLLAETVKHVCTLDGNNILEINSLFFMPFDYYLDLNTSKGRDIQNYMNNIKKIFQLGYYFSFNLDLTLSRQRQRAQLPSDNKFFWNKYLLKDLEQQNITKSWRVPIIQGFVDQFTSYLQNRRVELYLISRRSCYHSGTRYNSRGIDDEGNTANFVETEQIIQYNKYCCSFVMIRGSCPIFWSQSSITSPVKMTRNLEMTNSAFLKHFEQINEHYGLCLCINLMEKSKSNEQKLTEQFQFHIKNSNLQQVKYEYFDFHANCKGQKFDKINVLIEKVSSLLVHFGFFAEDLKQNRPLFNNNNQQQNVQFLQQQQSAIRQSNEPQHSQPLLSQIGVVRFNCIDCLDRSNVVSTKLAMKMFQLQMECLQVNIKEIFGNMSALEQLDCSSDRVHQFTNQFKNIWADNGDNISLQYCGTTSVISSVARKGKKFYDVFDQSMKSIERFYNSNFEDSVKQQSIDILLGNHSKITSVFDQKLEIDLRLRQKEYCTYQDISLFACTWNMCGIPPNKEMKLKKRLFFFDNGFEAPTENKKNNNIQNPNPDIIVVGLQEMVDLNAKNVMMSNNDKIVEKWVDLLKSELKQIDDYKLVKHKDLVGIFLVVFVKKIWIDRITKVDVDDVKTGLIGGKLGNKGAALIRMCVDDTSFLFINCHLQSGQNKVQERFSNLLEIHRQAFQEEHQKKEFKLEQCNYKLLLGDMNFRLENVKYDDAKSQLDSHEKCIQLNDLQTGQKILDELLEQDQLIKNKSKFPYIKNYQEGAIKFQPTYKYDIGSNVYDSSKKQRIPAWCDRILLWVDDDIIIKQPFYKRVELQDSDHRPVASYYILCVKKIDKQKLEQIKKHFYGLEEEKQAYQQNIDVKDQQIIDQEEEEDVSNFFNTPKLKNQDSQNQFNDIQTNQFMFSNSQEATNNDAIKKK